MLILNTQAILDLNYKKISYTKNLTQM